MTGRGPNISISVPMDSTVETAYSNKFESAGINQTKHEIALDVKVTVTRLYRRKSGECCEHGLYDYRMYSGRRGSAMARQEYYIADNSIAESGWFWYNNAVN